jgi:hypothetical protein
VAIFQAIESAALRWTFGACLLRSCCEAARHSVPRARNSRAEGRVCRDIAHPRQWPENKLAFPGRVRIQRALAGVSSTGRGAPLTSRRNRRCRRRQNRCSMVTMEPPVGFDAGAIRSKKAELLAAIPEVQPSKAVRRTCVSRPGMRTSSARLLIPVIGVVVVGLSALSYPTLKCHLAAS